MTAPRSADAKSPRRGRPTSEQAEHISRAILSAASDLFLNGGYERTTMQAIADAAGVPKSTLYKRYDDKLALLRAVVSERLRAWSDLSSSTNIHLPQGLEQRLKCHAETVIIWSGSAEVRAMVRLAEGDWPGAQEVRALLHAIGYQRMVDYLEKEICDHHAMNGAPLRDPRSVAETLMTLLAGTAWSQASAPPQEQQIAFAHRAVELLLHGRAAW